VSKRNASVPLQMVLKTRAHLMQRNGGVAINSFEAVSAGNDLGVRPQSYAAKSADTRGSVARKTVGVRKTQQAWASEEFMPPVQMPMPQSRRKLNKGEGTTLKSTMANALIRNASAEAVLEMTRANRFDVIGGVSDSELQMLKPRNSSTRVFLVQTWMFRLMTNRLLAGGLGVPPPILSRTYQVLSEGTAAAMQARKVSHVEFPFALRQLLAMLLTIFMVLAPICIGAFMDSIALVTIISFFTCMGYAGLNETARELEMPFGLDANDLNLVEYQAEFNDKLVVLLDQTIPELNYRSNATDTHDAKSSTHNPPNSNAATEAHEGLEEHPQVNSQPAATPKLTV